MEKAHHAKQKDRDELIRMRAELWPDAPMEEHASFVEAILAGRSIGPLPAALFVLEIEGRPIGFLEASLRSRADGCDPCLPVGFVEGWYVSPPFRRRGVGRALLQAAEDWARSQGCREMASDTWIDREEAQRAHEKLGFEMVDRCVNYRKRL